MWLWPLLPVFLAAVGICGFWVVFAMAVTNGSVNITEAFPYISGYAGCGILGVEVHIPGNCHDWDSCPKSKGAKRTCGAYPPQSCVFGQILNLGAFLGVVICFLKYQQVRDYGCHSCLNLVGLILGLLCAFGASLVGNFQQYNQLEVHVTGAFLAFVIGILYFWIQAFLTNQVKPRHGGIWIGPLRFFLSFCGSALFISTVALFSLQLHSEAAYCEWAMAMALFLLFGLFAVDFQHIGGCSVHVRHRRADDNSQNMQTSAQTLSL